MSGYRFSEQEKDYIRRYYHDGGPAAVMVHVDRPRASIIQCAVRMKITCNRIKAIKRVQESAVPLPGMTAEESAACMELRDWKRHPNYEITPFGYALLGGSHGE